MVILYIVGTPIGNLKDISQRAIETLKGVDLILCEDTRVTKKLLDHYQIKTSTLSYHQHSKLQKIDYIINLLKEEKDLALVSDAGTPGISDPGNKLIEKLMEIGSRGPLGGRWEGRSPSIKIVPIPGSSAITAAASISGLPTDKFLFLGFPPTKRKRKKFFEEIINSKYPVIFYESPYRIIKTLKELQIIFNRYDTCYHNHGIVNTYQEDRKIRERNIVVCRELTKKFETIYRGRIEEVIKEIEKDKVKGEFVVIVEGKK